MARLTLLRKTLSTKVFLTATFAFLLCLTLGQASFGQSPGDQRVREAQTLLAELNYRPGPIDGILGPRTLSAVLRFQIDHGLQPTRTLDDATFEKLRALRSGSETPSAQGTDHAVRTTTPPAAEADTTTPAAKGVGIPPTPESSANIPAPPSVRQEPRENRKGPSVATTPTESRPEVSALPSETTALAENFAPPGEPLGPSEEINPSREGGVPMQAPLTPAGESVGETPGSGSFFSFLLQYFDVNNALFLGLLGFAVLAVIAAVYTSIRGRQAEATEVEATPSEEQGTVLSAVPPDLVATAINPTGAAMSAASDATELLEITTNKRSPTEEVLEETVAMSPGEALLEDYAEIRPSKQPQDDQPKEDPLADLNVCLAFERFDQAEALVKDAIERYPERHEYLLRLLEVYVAAKNPLAFEYYARTLLEAVGANSPLMVRAVRWWNALCPERELFAAPLEEIRKS